MREKTRVATLVAAVLTGMMLTAAAPAQASTASMTTLTSSANPAVAGQAVTLTATVTGEGTTPTGQVVFGEPGVTLGAADLTNGVATLVLSTLPVGDHALTATYNGDADNDMSVGTLTQRVTLPPPPAVHVKPPRVTLVASTAKASVGDMVRLRWRSKRADSVLASGDWTGSQKARGHRDVRITERGKHVFKLTVTNAAGAKTAVVKVVAARKAKEFELVVTEDPVLIGDDVKVAADGFAKAEPFVLRLDGKVIMTGKADQKGQVLRTFEVPKGTAEGVVPLTITGSNPNRVGTSELNVIGPAKLVLTAAAPEVYKRDPQTITVTGLLPGETVTLTLGSQKLTTGTADADGTFVYTYDVGKPLGEQTVKATGVIPTRVGSVTYTVLDPGRGPNNGG